MAFFSRNFHHPAEVSFTPLFRLLDDYEAHSRQTNRHCSPRRQTGFQWQPKFDIREVAEAYELHGELPGINKDDVHIEFSDPQTLVIRGRSERTYTAGTSPHAQLEATPALPASPKSPAATETRERKNSHQATVETEDEALEHESAYEVVAEDDDRDAQEEKVVQKPMDRAKYWITERSVGDFYRSFQFPSRVEQDTVTASFRDGILSISVPKAKKHESRRINIA
ncbi:30 kDa heat shock protein [Escovopsis weberi]|uniref:30 kDa heat shock protein n=1 Tax=Escovopsis weberi TaxID=150374 RepID=A0A0M8N5L4_ESCWE|nr:30 kDa heat shock protein [Escovopsis weberi]